jgi:hypothetical protein
MTSRHLILPEIAKGEVEIDKGHLTIMGSFMPQAKQTLATFKEADLDD